MAGGYKVPPIDDLGVVVQRLAAHGERIDELERPTGTQLAETVAQLRAAVEELQATTAYLSALAPVVATSSSSGTSLTANTWTSDAGIRPAAVASTPTGRLRVTISAQLANAFVTFSIPGYVDRDSQLAGVNLLRQLYSAQYATMSKVWIVAGMPVSTPVTVQVECYGQSGSPASVVGAPEIVVEAIG